MVLHRKLASLLCKETNNTMENEKNYSLDFNSDQSVLQFLVY